MIKPMMKIRRPLMTACIALAALASPVMADNEINAVYDIEVAGVELMRLNFNATVSDDSYSSSVRVKTKGVAKYLKDFRMELASSGQRKSDRFLPTSFEREREKKGKSKAYAVVWSDGAPQIDDTSTPLLERVAKALRVGTSDPLAVLLQVALGQRDSFCSGKHRVYDGRDVYDVVIAPVAADGEGERCKVTTTTIAGSAYDKVKPTAPVDVYHITFKKSADTGIHVPVRITGKAEGKSFTASARSISIDGAAAF